MNRTYIGLIHINCPSGVCSLSSGFVVKWTHQRIRRKLLLLICKEKHSILSFPVILEKRHLDYSPLKQNTQKYFHLRGVTSFKPVPQLQKEILLQDMYQCFLQSVHRTHYTYSDKMYMFLAINNSSLQSRYTSKISFSWLGIHPTIHGLGQIFWTRKERNSCTCKRAIYIS